MKNIDVIIEMLCLTPNVQTITFTFTTMREKRLRALRDSLINENYRQYVLFQMVGLKVFR